jgi:hypothetical protein
MTTEPTAATLAADLARTEARNAALAAAEDAHQAHLALTADERARVSRLRDSSARARTRALRHPAGSRQRREALARAATAASLARSIERALDVSAPPAPTGPETDAAHAELASVGVAIRSYEQAEIARVRTLIEARARTTTTS